MASAVVLNGTANGFGKGGELGEQFGRIVVFELGSLNGGVEFGCIAHMMLIVMNLHGSGVDMGFEGTEGKA